MAERFTRLLIVDDHAVFRDCFTRALTETGEFEVVGEADTIAGAVAVLEKKPVDVVVLDYDLGIHSGTELLEHIRARRMDTRVLVLTAWVDEAHVRKLIELGISGVVLKRNDFQTVAAAIRAAAESKTWFDDQCLPALFEAPPPVREKLFTERERGTLRLVVEGHNTKDIAWRMSVSEASVKATLQRLFHKTGVRTRGQLVREALENYRDEY